MTLEDALRTQHHPPRQLAAFAQIHGAAHIEVISLAADYRNTVPDMVQTLATDERCRHG